MPVTVSVPGTAAAFIVLTAENTLPFILGAPEFCFDGRIVSGELAAVAADAPRTLASGVQETRYSGTLAACPDVVLTLTLRRHPESCFIRFRYELRSFRPLLFSGTGLTYCTAEFPAASAVTEISMGHFEEGIHSYCLTETPIAAAPRAAGIQFMGPLCIGEIAGQTCLLGYEHGSTAPDAFIAYALHGEKLRLAAVKGNVPPGHDLGAEPYTAVWLQAGLLPGGKDDCAACYRTFVLKYMAENPANRTPYIFYNTWNFQERNQAWHHKPYLADMRQERMLKEIEAAHQMGIDVFVIDTGWYARTGEWAVNPERFDADLHTVRESLKERGMKLGLWFSPCQSAISAAVTREHDDCRCETEGHKWEAAPVWETEESFNMCLVSRWWETFADALIRLHREVGVTYFKLDAIGQYGCDSPAHFHGGPAASREERRQASAFAQILYLNRMADKVCAACPEAIIDFDVTEGGRSFGLAFLASGKYFLMNNGPYYQSLDDPQYAPGGGMGANVLVFPGPARARNCRATLGFDKWLPSVLFLTHYLPDAPAASQEINVASLVLGHNGIWGDLCSLSPASLEFFCTWLGYYRQVRDDITAAAPVRTGIIGGSPEIHEKILPASGRGAVALFAPRGGVYTYVTHTAVTAEWQAMPGLTVERLAGGQARITMTLTEAGGKAVFFGAQ